MAEQSTARKKIFISHSSQDKPIAEELCRELEKKGFGCWFFNRDVSPVENFAEAIVDAISQSFVLLLLLSENANKSPHVLSEVSLAFDITIPIFPIKIENVKLSKALKYYIGTKPWLDIYDRPLEKHFPAIISAVSKLIKADEQIKDPTPVTQIPDAKRKPGDFLLQPIVRNFYEDNKAKEPATETQVPDTKYKPGLFLLQSVIRNPFEDNVAYIKIPGGTYKFSVTGKMETVSDLYFCKYLVTNKRYRTFISYLEGKEKELEETLPLKEFSRKLTELAKSIDVFLGYLGTNPRGWGKKLRSDYDEDKRLNENDQPVVGVSWYAARAYCSWLSCLQQQEGLYRLPTEKEWEWAAAGREPDGSLRKYPWAKSKGEPNPELANYGNNVGATTPVGRYPEGAMPEGLMDMAGNAWEWMENPFTENKIGRALRGGSWDDRSGYLRCAARYFVYPRDYWSFSGFRVVCEFAPGHG